MRQSRFVAMLSALALGTVSLGDIKVAIRDVTEFPSADPVVMTGVVGSGNAVSVSTAQMLAQLPGSTIGHDFIMWVYDDGTVSGAPDESIGSITLTYSSSSPVGNVKLLIAPPPLPTATNSQADFNTDPIQRMDYPGALNLGPISVTNSDFRDRVSVSIAVTGDVGSSTVSRATRSRSAKSIGSKPAGAPWTMCSSAATSTPT